MPSLSTEDQAKLVALEALIEQARAKQARVLVAELLRIDWPAPDGSLWFAHTQIDEVRGFTAIADFAEVKSRLITSKGSPFLDIPRSAAIADDSVDFNASDIDGEISRLCYKYGQGIRGEVFAYYPDVDLRLSMFTGTLKAPKDANGVTLKLSLAAGFRSPNLIIPRRLPAAGCQFVFGGLLPTQTAINEHRGCPYNRHLEEWSSEDPSYQNNANGTIGAGGAYSKATGGTAWNCGASHDEAVISEDAAFEFTVTSAYATAGFTTTSSPRSGNTDFAFGLQWNPDGSVTLKYSGTSLIANVAAWVPGDTFRVELRAGRFRAYKGGEEIIPTSFTPPAPAFPLYLGIAIQNVGAGISAGQVAVGDIGAAPRLGLLDPSTGLPWTDCARDSVETCEAHLDTNRFWPGFKTIIDTVVVGQTKGPNLLSTSRGNDSSLTDPIRVIAGERDIKNLGLLAFAPENDTNHPDKGFVRALFDIAEGPMKSLTLARINDILVGFEHLNVRLGTLPQAPTGFSPNIGAYGGTAVFFGRIQGDFRNVAAGDLTGSIHGQGLSDLRVYSDVNTFVEQYSTNRGDWLLRVHCDKRWGFGEDYARYSIESVIDTREWCDESVTFVDPNGNHFDGTRSSFNAELNGRSTQQQIRDICVAGRIGIPFIYNGLKVFYPLRKETIDGSIKVFADRGEDANICCDSSGRPILTYSYTGDDELINEYTVTFDDAANGFAETPLIFGNQRQQLAAGKAWGDTSIRVVKKSIPGFGITNVNEAARLGNMLLALGPLDEGGIENNLEVKFTTWWSQALDLHPYKLVKLDVRILNRLFESLEIDGFEYFRIKKMTRKGDLRVELVVQAYPVDYYEKMETTPDEDAPPIFDPPPIGEPNPGGGRTDRPCTIGFASLTHTDSAIQFELQGC
jgi:hypothetical protein